MAHHRSRSRDPLLAAPVILLVLLACSLGGGGGGGGAATKLEEVKAATVQIQSEGSFVDPQVGVVLNAAGRGSGFIVDPSGIVVTNNHVVTGAALVKVWVGGEQDGELRNARVLGVSECSDLAVLDIEGEGFPFLDWYAGEPTVGMDVYAAGFPLGEPEFSLTKGIISKESASGDTEWASVEEVLMHDATINPGNSGGPLVTEDGRVVGVNYMGRPDASQYFAIAASEAKPVVEKLRGGEDYLSIGINGTAVQGDQVSGVWISSVASGSPADVSGIKGGDLLLTIEDLVLATDGTMLDYCDILKSHAPTDSLDVQIMRFGTGEAFEGQLNGRPLAAIGNPPPSQPTTSGGQPTTASGAAAVSYVPVQDDLQSILIEIPSTWTQVRTQPWVVDGQTIGSMITAAEDENTFLDFTGPGMALSITDEFDRMGGIEGMLQALQSLAVKDCGYDQRYDYSTPVWQGKFDVYVGCAGHETVYVTLAAEPVDHPGGYLAVLMVQVPSASELDIFDHLSKHFTVIGPLP